MRGSSTLWRALQAARRSNLAAAGEPAPVAGSPATTRRALLQAIAAAGVVAAMPRPAHASTRGRVAIVGGGIAGLSALHHLTEAGVDAHLYEARSRMGGRMFTHAPAGGQPFEIGGQLVNTDHADMHALAKQFGVRLIDRKPEPHYTLILADGRLIPEAEVAEALRGIAGQIGRDADRLDKHPARVAAELDCYSIRSYLEKHSALIREPWVRRLLEATSRTEYGVEPDKASAIELIFNLPTVDGQRFEVLGGADERFVIEGGSGALVAAMAEHYADRITTGRRLLRIDRHRAGARLSFLDGSSAEADRVIVAVPAPIARQIDFGVPLPHAWRAFIAQMEIGRNEKVQAAAATKPWHAPMGVGGELWQTDAKGYDLGWDGSVHTKDGVSQVWTWFLGGNDVDAQASPAELAARFAASAEPAIPGMGAATAAGPFRRTGWHKDPLTLGAYVNYPPGQLSRFAHLLWTEGRHPLPSGRVLFAGEHLSDAYPGYMNGAAETGRMAAETILGRKLLSQAA